MDSAWSLRKQQRQPLYEILVVAPVGPLTPWRRGRVWTDDDHVATQTGDDSNFDESYSHS